MAETHKFGLMSHSFEAVDYKVNETDFFLGKMVASTRQWFEFSCYLSAYLSAARSITFALQQFKVIQGFEDWYQIHQSKLKADPIAKLMKDKRDDHVHGGPSPIAGRSSYEGKVEYRFKDESVIEDVDIVSSCRQHFTELLKIVYDCYIVLGVHIDPQQYYTRDHFGSMGMTIKDAETEVYGWVLASAAPDGWAEDDRWHHLRSKVGECNINHLFKGYLGKVTPQPKLPERMLDFEFTDEDKGWVYIPHGFATIEDYLKSMT